MSDKADIDIPSVIASAIAAAGPRGSNEGAWVGKINDAIPRIVSMMSEGSRQHRIAEEVATASVFTAIYRGYEIEESSKRCLVQIETSPSKKYPDGIEPIRSHRTDNAQGKHMKAQLDQIEPGANIVVWKAMESSDDGGEKYRVLVHVEKRPKFNKNAQSVAPPVAPAEGNSGSGEVRAAPPVEPESPPGDSIDSERLQGWRAGAKRVLSPADLEDLNFRLGAIGYTFDGVSEVEWVDIVRPLIREYR